MRGNLIPTILIITTCIAGITSLQFLFQTNDIKYFRNCYFNLNYNRFYFYQSNKLEIMKDKEPDEMSGTIKAIPNEWTVWDFIEVNVTKTCKEVLEYLKQEYKINTETFLS